MRRIYSLIGVSLLFASLGAATDWSTMEAFLGYNLVRFNPNSNFVPSFNANGGSGQFVYNFDKWFGVALDMGAVNRGTLNYFNANNNALSANVNTTVMNLVAGPRFTYQNHSRFIPFGQVLFGGAWAWLSTPITLASGQVIRFPSGVVVSNPSLPFQSRLTASNSGFAMLVGGGVDLKINRHVTFRPIEADYYLTRADHLLTDLANIANNTPIVTGNNSNRNNFRYAAGVNFFFGPAR
jgi:hypothetical protein